MAHYIVVERKDMGWCRAEMVGLASVMMLLLLFPAIHGWGTDGHLTVCRIAQSRLSGKAAVAVKKLLPVYARNDLGSMCSWADRAKFRYRWSSALHYINTPSKLCTYNYNRDCKDERGVKGRCTSGAISNYTSQLLTYNSTASRYNNLTEALLFLSHYVGDIHQPLHVGFASDKGGNNIGVRWYRRKSVLHSVWDSDIIETSEKSFYRSNVNYLIDAIQKDVAEVTFVNQTKWAGLVKKWESCGYNKPSCPDIYASESIKAACDWAYKGVNRGSVLQDVYFRSRLPIVNLRLAQAGVRLAAILNHIFR